jgi:adenylate cyclase
MEQVLEQRPARLGDYLPCTAGHLESVLRWQAERTGGTTRRRLGDLLVESRALSRLQLRAGIEAQRVDRLRRCVLFAAFSRDDLTCMIHAFTEATADDGEVFIHQGTSERQLFVLASGEADVFRINADAEEVLLATVRPGEPVGEMGYISGGPRIASVRARGRCELLCTSYEQLRTLLAGTPRLDGAFLDVIARRLVHTSRLYEQGQHRLRRVERTLQRLGDFLDLSELAEVGAGIEILLDRLVRTASALTEADRASLFLIDPVTGELWSMVAEGTEAREIRIPAGHGIAGWVAKHKEVLNVADAYQDPRFHRDVDQHTGYRTRTILCTPIWSLGNEVLGVVQVVNKREGLFGDADEHMIRAFAHQAAVAVENFRLHRRMLANHRRLATLLDVASSVADTLDLPSLVRKIVARTPEALHCERASFFVVDDATGELWSMESHGSELSEIRFPMSEGLAGHCASSGEIVNVPDAYQDRRFNRQVDRITGYHTCSVLCVPVTNREGKITGVTQCINKQEGRFVEEDEQLLRAMSSQISVALDNARLHAREVGTRHYLERVQESIASAILTLDEGYRVVVHNRAAARLLPAVARESASRDLRELLGAQNRELLALVESAYAEHEATAREGLALHRTRDDTSTINASVVPLEDADGAFTGLVLVMEDITRERQVKSAFSRYLAPAVIDQLLANPHRLRLGGEQRDVTVLFTDIEGFTALSENVDPEQLVQLLNDYFEIACQAVFEHGGTIDKIVGDSLHVLFNAPVDQPDHARSAVRCALALDVAAQSLIARRASEGLSLGRTRVGINTGRCAVGNFGGAARFDYTAHGDAINTAARLEGANKYLGTRICVSSSTVAACADIAFRPIARVLVQGRREAIEVFEPLHAQDAHSPRIAAYLGAYERLEAGDLGAATIFAELTRRYPDDELARMHATRLARSETGTVIELTGK